MMPKSLSTVEKDALESMLYSDNWPVLLGFLIKVVEQQEHVILSLSSEECEVNAQKLTLAKGKQLGARATKQDLLKLKDYCKKQYGI